MIRAFVSLILAVTLALPVDAQERRNIERSIERQRAAIEALTACIADNDPELARDVIMLDQNTKEFRDLVRKFPNLRVVEKCFESLPGAYRMVGLESISLEGGLAEGLLSRDEKPLLTRLNMAAVAPAPTLEIPAEAMAMCMVRGAPHLVAMLFDTPVNSPEELQAINTLMPIANACLPEGRGLEGSPLGLRSILATAAFHLLAAQDEDVEL